MSCIVPTTHAVTRYRERVRPALNWDAAEHELVRLVASAVWQPEAPSWLIATSADMYAVVGDVVFPLVASKTHVGRWLAVTCITRGCLGDAARRQRNEVRRRRPSNTGRTRRHSRHRFEPAFAD